MAAVREVDACSSHRVVQKLTCWAMSVGRCLYNGPCLRFQDLSRDSESVVVMVRMGILVVATAIVINSVVFADWPQFRGTNSAGIADDTAVVTEFGPGKNELWSVAVGAGHSSPCIVADSIFLTSFVRDRKELQVMGLDRVTGRLRWKYTLRVKEFERGHPSFNPASSTPASDGERVVIYFGSYGLICLDLKGRKQWEMRLPLTRSYSGNAVSPVISGDKVILYRGNYVDHYLLALDKRTGEELWRVRQSERFTPNMACTACPIVAGGRVIVHAARSVQAFDLQTGKRVWILKCSTTATSTPIVAGQEVIVATWNQTGEASLTPKFPTYDKMLSENDKNADRLIDRQELPRLFYFHRSAGTEAPQNGYPFPFAHGDRNKNGTISRDEWDAVLDRQSERVAGFVKHGLIGIPLESEGLLGEGDIRRLESQGIPEVPSPISYGGHVYFVKNGGVLTCVDLAKGKRRSRIRTRGTGTHYASPIIADGKLFSTAGNGTVSVLSVGPRPRILAVNKMGVSTYATPAVVQGVIYVRTHEKLYAFGE